VALNLHFIIKLPFPKHVFNDLKIFGGRRRGKTDTSEAPLGYGGIGY